MTESGTTNDLELRISRRLSATPEEVFDAYTDAEKQKIWFSILDEEPGIVEIDRPHRLVTDSAGVSPDGQEMATRITVTFEADGDGTLMSVHQTGFPVPEIRDFFAAEVWIGALDRIAAYVDQNRRTS